jgi:hypothetical protein
MDGVQNDLSDLFRFFLRFHGFGGQDFVTGVFEQLLQNACGAGDGWGVWKYR